MSYNVRCSRPIDGDNTWPRRRNAVARVLRNHDVDLAGLQEPFIEQINDLSSDLGDYAWLGVGRNDGGLQGEFNPIFYRADRLQVLEQSTFWLSPHPQLPGSRGWDAHWPRIVTWARFLDNVSGAEFYLCNTHLDHAGSDARAAGARMLRSHAIALAAKHPVIVTGDLNCTVHEPPYQLLTAGENRERSVLLDTFGNARHPHDGPTVTFPADTETGPPDRKIDYILVSPSVEIIQEQVCEDRDDDGTYPSDHLPLLAELDLA